MQKAIHSYEVRQVVGAESIGTQAAIRLSSCRTAHVHSSYGGAINLETPSGLICVVPASAGEGPISLVVRNQDFSDVGPLRKGDPVAVDGNVLITGAGAALDWRSAKVYDPPRIFRRKVHDLRKIERNVEAARATAVVEGDFRGMGSLLFDLWGSESHMESQFSPRARVAMANLLAGISKRDTTAIKASARELSGLGVGLTPSGDDLLAGLMIAGTLGAFNGLRGYDPRASNPVIAGEAKGRTTRLSLEFLMQAAFGRSNGRLRRLMEAVYTGGIREVERASADVLGIGGSSGTDLMAGALMGVRVALGERVST